MWYKCGIFFKLWLNILGGFCFKIVIVCLICLWKFGMRIFILYFGFNVLILCMVVVKWVVLWFGKLFWFIEVIIIYLSFIFCIVLVILCGLFGLSGSGFLCVIL